MNIPHNNGTNTTQKPKGRKIKMNRQKARQHKPKRKREEKDSKF